MRLDEQEVKSVLQSYFETWNRDNPTAKITVKEMIAITRCVADDGGLDWTRFLKAIENNPHVDTIAENFFECLPQSKSFPKIARIRSESHTIIYVEKG